GGIAPEPLAGLLRRVIIGLDNIGRQRLPEVRPRGEVVVLRPRQRTRSDHHQRSPHRDRRKDPDRPEIVRSSTVHPAPEPTLPIERLVWSGGLLAREAWDARVVGWHGRLGHGPGWLWPWPRRPGLRVVAQGPGVWRGSPAGVEGSSPEGHGGGTDASPMCNGTR